MSSFPSQREHHVQPGAERCVGKGNALPVDAGYMNQAMWDGLLRLVRQLMSTYSIPIS